MKIGILNYNSGNIKSLSRALSEIGFDYVIVNERKDFSKIDQLILPGVGSFGNAMNEIKKKNFIEPLVDYIDKSKKLIGICLGMQLLATESEEYKITSGLNFIPGTVKKIIGDFKNKNFIKVPNIGWRNLIPIRQNLNNFKLNFTGNEKFYFLHSFYYDCDDQHILFYSDYNKIKIPSIITCKNIIGLQFHPEKSREHGIKLLDKILKA